MKVMTSLFIFVRRQGIKKKKWLPTNPTPMSANS